MAQLNTFTGGLSTRLAPHLISVSEAVIYSNIDPSFGPLTPIMDDTYMNKTLYKNFYLFKDVWVNSDEDRDYVEFQNKLYYSNGVDIPQKSSDGLTWFNLGILKPATAPGVTLGTTGLLEGTFRYCYTYYNSIDGTESQPSDYSTEVITTLNKVSVTVVASTDLQVDKIRLYRIGGSYSVMMLVQEVANTSATLEDNSISPSDVLTSTLYGRAPEGLNYLTLANTMFFGAKEDKLYFSEIAFVNSWSPYYFIDFDANITGIGATQNGLLVFTEYKTYIVTGTTPSTLSKYLLNDEIGCILHKSIRFINNTLLWYSYEGICASSGTEIKSLSRDKLGTITLVPRHSCTVDSVYYLSHSNGILVIDTRFGLVFRELSTIALGMFDIAGVLYYTNPDKKLYSLGTSEVPKIMHYLSPKFPDGALSKLKNYKTLYLNCTGNLEFTTYISDKKVLTVNLTEGVQEIKLPQDERLGYWLQFEVKGLGTLLEVEYKLEERQNGR